MRLFLFAFPATRVLCPETKAEHKEFLKYLTEDRVTRWIAALLLGLTASCAGPGAASTSPSDRTVVLISLDGFPAYMFEDPRLPAPTLRKLMQEGAWAKG